VDELDMPAIQTYDNGKVVNWDQPTPPSGEEPEHPAPTVQLAAKSAEGHGHSGMDAAANTQGSGAQAAPATDTTARWLGGAGLVVGALGVGFGAGATLRARRATTAAAKNGSDSTE
jgi:hypothetical protein